MVSACSETLTWPGAVVLVAVVVLAAWFVYAAARFKV